MWAQHLQMFWLTKSPKPKYIQVRKAAKRHIWEVRTRECLVTRLIALSTNRFTYTRKYFPQSFVFNSICLVWLYWWVFFAYFQTDGFPVWEKEDSGGDAEAESEGAQSSHERTGPRANETGATGEEDHRWHKENGQTGTDGMEDKNLCFMSYKNL